MVDERRLYIKQLLRNYKQGDFELPVVAHTVNYRYPNDTKNRYRLISHNEGIDMVIQYIDELERKVDELQHIDKIIKFAKENVYE